jgi:hypothetical protein
MFIPLYIIKNILDKNLTIDVKDGLRSLRQKKFQEGAELVPSLGKGLLVSQTGGNLPEIPGRRHPETPEMPDIPDPPKCPITPISPNLPTKFPLLCRPNSNLIRKFPGIPDSAGPKSPPCKKLVNSDSNIFVKHFCTRRVFSSSYEQRRIRVFCVE